MAYALLEISYTCISVAMLVFALRKEASSTPISLRLKHWFLFGFFFNLYSLSWLYTVYPLIWMQKGVGQLLGIGFVHVITSTISAIPFCGVAFHTLLKSKHYKPLFFASLLTLAEILRSILLSLLFLGEGTTIAIHLQAGTLGNALSSTPFIEYAYFGGAFGLTFILGYLVYSFQTKQLLSLYKKHIFATLLVLIYIHYLVPVTTFTKEIGIVTTHFRAYTDKEYQESPLLFKEQADRVHTLTQNFSSTTAIIAYPEDTRYLVSIDPAKKQELDTKFQHTLFIDGTTIEREGKYLNVSFFYKHDAEKSFMRAKEFLLPFNEYMPYILEKIATVFFTDTSFSEYSKNHTYAPFYSKKVITLDDSRIGTILCSEILSYTVIRKLKEEHPDIVFFQSKLSVFHDNPWFIMHERSFTKVTAAQLRTPFVSSINGAPSFIISPHGKILKSIPTGFSTTTYRFN